jgi:predicted dienelactone hydrolase
MYELIVLELLTGLFLFLPLIRPLIKQLWDMEGLALLPLLALGITIAIFPAYGFRPECLPLLVYTIVLNIISVPTLIAALTHLRNDDFRERLPVLTVVAIGILGAVIGAALYFLPVEVQDIVSDESGGRATVIALRDDSQGAELFVRVYPAATDARNADSPLMVLIPPVSGSVTAVDRVCMELEARGFRVVSYVRRGFDLPLSPGKLARLFRVLSKGRESEAINAQGRLFEDTRMQDIEFLLTQIRQNPALGFTAQGAPVFMAGYGAGGAALTMLAGNRGFITRHPEVRGIIAIEGPILSMLRGDEREPFEPRAEANWFKSMWAGITHWLAERKPAKITHIANVPNPALPILFLVSDQVTAPRYRDDRYNTILRVFHDTDSPALLAAVPGAGPLSYSDVPEKYPLYETLFPGQALPVWRRMDYAPGTASLMVNFAAIVLEGAPSSLTRQSLPPGQIYYETGRAWNYQHEGGILYP